MISLNLSASPSGAGPSYSYAFQPISQGDAAVVTVSVPNAPPGASWSVYAGGQLVGSVIGANPVSGVYLANGRAITITGTSSAAPGNALLVGIEGSVNEVPVTSPSPSASAVNVVNIPTYTTVASVPAGSDFVYTIPTGTPLRLVAFRAVFTASSQSGRRYPYLWQLVAGDSQPTVETLLTPDSIGLSEQIVMNAEPGGSPLARDTPRRPYATSSLPTALTTLYTGPAGGYLADGLFIIDNPLTTAESVTVEVAGFAVYQGTLGSGTAVSVQLPVLQAGDTLAASASAAGLYATLSGTENADNRRVSNFEGLLLPPGSTIQTATGGLQSADQWTDINLAFVQS